MPVYLLSDKNEFPSPLVAEKNGLLAVGGSLTQERLLLAYKMGIFPWFSEGEPILWWSPDPRLVLFPQELKISKSLQKIIKKNIFQITMDTSFQRVINQCAQVRLNNNEETWIVDEMITSYTKLYDAGFAHSVEAWCNGEIVGGLYGVSMGKAFFGESMFTTVDNASKVAFVTLVNFLKENKFEIIDCQVTTTHLKRFGAKEISRKKFISLLKAALDSSTLQGKWRL